MPIDGNGRQQEFGPSVEYFASRLQIQEELVKHSGQDIIGMTASRGLAETLGRRLPNHNTVAA